MGTYPGLLFFSLIENYEGAVLLKVCYYPKDIKQLQAYTGCLDLAILRNSLIPTQLISQEISQSYKFEN